MSDQQQLAEIVSLQRFKRLRERDGKPEPIIAHWKCRVGVCLTRMGVTQTAYDVLEIFNRELKRRRERPITEDEVMVCAEHTDKLNRSRW